jgi:hypothetical protein
MRDLLAKPFTYHGASQNCRYDLRVGRSSSWWEENKEPGGLESNFLRIRELLRVIDALA